jgi:hypothetical protein
MENITSDQVFSTKVDDGKHSNHFDGSKFNDLRFRNCTMSDSPSASSFNSCNSSPSRSEGITQEDFAFAILTYQIVLGTSRTI